MPMAAARTTLGSKRASRMNPRMPSAATAYRSTASYTAQSGHDEEKPHQQREIRPGNRQQVGQPGALEGAPSKRFVDVDVVTDHQGRNQCPLIGWSMSPPIPSARLALSAARHQGGGSAKISGLPRARTTAAMSSPSARTAARRTDSGSHSSRGPDRIGDDQSRD